MFVFLSVKIVYCLSLNAKTLNHANDSHKRFNIKDMKFRSLTSIIDDDDVMNNVYTTHETTNAGKMFRHVINFSCSHLVSFEFFLEWIHGMRVWVSSRLVR